MLKGLTLLAATEVGSRIRYKIAALGYYGAAGVVAFLGLVFCSSRCSSGCRDRSRRSARA